MAENTFQLHNDAASQSAGRLASKQKLACKLDAGAKRLLDIIASLLGLFLLSPLFVCIAWRIKCDSPGPVFYRGLRLGFGGKTFGILKFRTMYESAASYNGPPVTSGDDPRITPFGRWLRDTKLNELPQLWNVLLGEMSLVGPRPEDPSISVSLPLEIHAEILSVRPGITSPASILYRNEEALLNGGQVIHKYLESVLPSKLRLDQLYVRNHSFWLDLDILFWTLLILLPYFGAYPPAEISLFSGPISKIFRRYISWFTVDALVTFAALSLAGLIWRSMGPLNVGWYRALPVAICIALLFSITNWTLRVNRIVWSQAEFGDMLFLLPAAGLAAFLALLANHLLAGAGWPPFPSGMVLTASAFSLAGYILVRYRTRLVAGLAEHWLALTGVDRGAGERILIIGGGGTAHYATWLFNQRGRMGMFHICGLIDDDINKLGMRVHGIQVLGRREDIPALVAERDIGILVFAIHNIASDERQKLLEICASTPARLVFMPDIQDVLSIAAIFSLDTRNHSQKDWDCIFPICQPEGGALTAWFTSWLEGLEANVQAGALEEVLAQITGMRERMQPHISRLHVRAGDTPSPPTTP